MAQHVEIIARGLLRAGDRILLCRNRKKGYSYLPGGHVEFGESAESALKREFLEECDLRVVVRGLAQVSEGVFKQEGRVRHEVNLVFHVEPKDRLPEVVSCEPDIEFHWLSRRKIKGADIRPASVRALLAQSRRTVVFDSSVRA